MNKKQMMLMSLIVAALSLVHAATQPNILFLSMDDLKPELGCFGSTNVKTPNIDRLAQQGRAFANHHVQQAICGPSRASMFSGLRPDTTKVWDLQHTCREECPQAFTMQEYFKKNGYETVGSGKIMHGFKNDDPLSWSVPYLHPEHLPFLNGKVPALNQQYQGAAIHDAVKKLKESGIKGYKPQQKFMAKLNAKPSTECLDLPDNAYSDGAMTDWALSMLDQLAASEKPFFLTLGYRKPHLPFVAPKKYWDLFDRDKIALAPFREHAKGSPEYAYHTWGELKAYSDVDETLSDDQQRELIHGYYACVAFVDAQIGRVIDKLERSGLDKNTIVVLWGDHGWHLGDHGMWCKHSNFEQATRSPLIISVPEFQNPGITESPVESVDIFPTLCELAELAVPEQLEGISLVPILKDAGVMVKDFAMSQYPRRGTLMGYALRDKRYRAVFWVDHSVVKGGQFVESMIQDIELFDYDVDPLETINLAENPEYKNVVALFEKLFKEWVLHPEMNQIKFDQ
jgi:arylsulfatase A-like enzyme